MYKRQVQSTELSAQIRTQEDTLADLQSEYTYLAGEMEMKTNLSAVQEYATNTLKMVKMDRSQVTYVTTGQENNCLLYTSWIVKCSGTPAARGKQLFPV